MCTAIGYKNGDHYFGRTLDYHHSFGESVVITPRNYPFPFAGCADMAGHHAMIGMAHMAEGCPLYYEASNEKGLSMAGLNFPGYACYRPPEPGRDNAAAFELIPWVLGRCATLAEARTALQRLNVTGECFRDDLPATPLHWLIADKSGALVVESTAEGVQIHENPVGVLTNSPPLPYQLLHLSQYRGLSAGSGDNRFAPGLELPPCGRGMGGIGLPGDYSSPSRFVRCAFALHNAEAPATEKEAVSQFFHILATVEVPRGCVRLENGGTQFTLYTCCCNTDRGIYYYTTYDNRQITAVDMHHTDLDSDTLTVFSPVTEGAVHRQN